MYRSIRFLLRHKTEFLRNDTGNDTSTPPLEIRLTIGGSLILLTGVIIASVNQIQFTSIIREGNESTLLTEFRKRHPVNFTYDPTDGKATAFVLTICNASVYTIYPIVALGLNPNGTVLHPLEHRVWAQRNGNKWQTIGFICESNTIKGQDICLDTEQNVCHLEIHPDETPETVLVYVGNGCACMRTLCDSIVTDTTTVETYTHSNICVCNSNNIMGCNFNYSAPVTSHQLIQCNYTLHRDLLPTPTTVAHDDLSQLLKRTRNNGQRTLITIHHNAERIHPVPERVKKDGEHHWWETVFGWSPTATGILNLMLHPTVVLLVLTYYVYCL
ncbi:hypothetical protein QYF61_009346 [Mycteria americana]|uniref:Uncharacterized protein n=1 Tax=Mycteria americana TaxID=33587 RepID=A0AAN7N6V4_MYCAM|nr:hypothetical protein QYF61_009346 [Mycteria americana]